MPLPLPLLPGRGQPPKHRGCLVSARAVVAQPLFKAPLSLCWVAEALHLLDWAHRLVIHAFRSASEEPGYSYRFVTHFSLSLFIASPQTFLDVKYYSLSMNRYDICSYPSSPPFKALCVLIRNMHGADQGDRHTRCTGSLRRLRYTMASTYCSRPSRTDCHLMHDLPRPGYLASDALIRSLDAYTRRPARELMQFGRTKVSPDTDSSGRPTLKDGSVYHTRT